MRGSTWHNVKPILKVLQVRCIIHVSAFQIYATLKRNPTSETYPDLLNSSASLAALDAEKSISRHDVLTRFTR